MAQSFWRGFGALLRRASPRADAGASVNNASVLAAMRAAIGGGVDEKTALGVAAFNRCVELVTGAVAVLPLDVFERRGGTRRALDDHPVAEVLQRRPNAWQTPSEFRRLLMAHVLLRGDGMAMKVTSGGKVIALLPMNPDRCDVVQRDDGKIEYRYMTTRGERVTLAREDVFHVRAFSLDGLRGLSVLARARGPLAFSRATETHGTALFQNKAQIAQAFKHPGAMSDAAYARFKRDVDELRGAENAGKSLILEEGMDSKEIQMTSTDAQWLESRKDNRAEIYMSFGVPPHLAGDTEKSTSFGSGIGDQNIGFLQYTMDPHFVAWEEAIRRDLLDAPGDRRVYAKFNRNAFLRVDVEKRYRAYQIALQWGFASPDEVRALEDWNPRPDGLGGVYYDPPNTAGGTKEQGHEPQQSA